LTNSSGEDGSGALRSGVNHPTGPGAGSGNDVVKAKAKTSRNAAKNASIKKRTPMTAYTKRQQSIWSPKVKPFKPSKHRSTASIHPNFHNIDEQEIGSGKFSITQGDRVFSFLVWPSLDLSEKLLKTIKLILSFEQQRLLRYKR
jgi:hypothetical protein